MAKSPPAVPAGGNPREPDHRRARRCHHRGRDHQGSGVVRVRPRWPQNAARPSWPAWPRSAIGGTRLLAWGAPVGPVAVYWLFTGLLAVAALGVVSSAGGSTGPRRRAMSSRRDTPHHKLEGVATRAHVVAHAGSRKLLDEAKHLRPSITKPKPHQVGLRLGTEPRSRTAVSELGTRRHVGPPGAGKGLNVAIPSILDWNGPVVTTSPDQTTWP